MSQRLQRIDVKRKAAVRTTFLPPVVEVPRTTSRPITECPATSFMPTQHAVGGNCAIRFLYRDWNGVFPEKHIQLRGDSRVGLNSMPKLLKPPMDQIDQQISHAGALNPFELNCPFPHIAALPPIKCCARRK